MKLPRLLFSFIITASIVVAGCDSTGSFNESDNSVDESAFRSAQQDAYMEQITDIAIDALTVGGLSKNLDRPPLWADGELFISVVTPAQFKASSGPFDELYASDGAFKDGVPLISESKPGDQDFNGGRWHLNVLKMGVDPAKYATATSVEDLDLNDFMSRDKYFECPVRPRRGKGN
jgi:hypothetical protein